MKQKKTFILAFLISCSAMAIPDLNKPYRIQNPQNAILVPTAFADTIQSHQYHLLPLSYRVKVDNGNAKQRLSQFPSGKVRIEAHLIPYPETFEAHPQYQQLIEEIRKSDPQAAFLYPIFRNPVAKLFGPINEWTESVHMRGGVGASPNLMTFSVIVKSEAGAWVKEDMKRSLGILGKIEFKVRAKSGNQTIDWPIGFAMHVGGINE